MKKEYITIEQLHSDIDMTKISQKFFSDIFLVNYENGTVYLSQSMADILSDNGEQVPKCLSVHEMIQHFTAASQCIFEKDLNRIIEGKTEKTDSHMNIRKNRRDINVLVIMLKLDKPGYIMGITHINFDLTHEYNARLEKIIHQLKQAELTNQLILEGSTDYIYQLDIVNNICTFSPKATEVLDLDNNVFSNAMDKLLSFIIPEDRSVFLTSFTPFLSGKSKYHKAEYRVKTRQGDIIWISCQGKGIHDADGNPLLIAGSLIDITEKKENDEKIYHMLHYDMLTGLKNKCSFEEDLSTYLADPSAKGSVLYINIQNFKAFNEIFGHSFANKILIEFCRIINLYITNSLGIYRLEGNEFLVHLKEYELEEIQNKLAPFLIYLSKQWELEGHYIFIRANIGVAIYPNDGRTPAELLKNVCMTSSIHSKYNTNKNVFFSDTRSNRCVKNYQLEAVLNKDINDGMKHFRIVYQPIIKFINGKPAWFGAEALLRYSNPELSELSQKELIENLEYSGLILPLGRWIIQQAIKECAGWHNLGFPKIIHINISAHQVADKGLIEHIRKCCQDAGLAPRWVVFELTETSLINNFEIANQFCQNLKKMGAGVALDDFGIGYSSLNYLKKLTITQIKIDRIFVQHLQTDNYNQVILKCILELAQTLNVDCCAEGIENSETLDKIMEMKVPLMQGFYFDKPLEAEIFRKELPTHN